MDDSNNDSTDVLLPDDSWTHDRTIPTLSSSALMVSNEESETFFLPSHPSHNSSSQDPEEDDNWSRQVETDELVRVPSSVMEEEEDNDHPEEDGGGPITGPVPPQREEPTLKEKLVERERQRRVETERARLKRQFALRNSVTEEQEGDDEDNNNADDYDAIAESVAGTVGEGSVVAPVEVLEEERMTYPMERFLQEQGSNLDNGVATTRDPLRDAQNQRVVMERFLQEPVLVEPATEEEQGDPSSTVEQSVSFDIDIPESSPMNPVFVGLRTTSTESVLEEVNSTPLRSLSRLTYDVAGNASIEVNTPGDGGTSVDGVTLDDDVARMADLVGVEGTTLMPLLDDQDTSLLPSESTNLLDEPRVLGLTQAEIEELEAIDEVSQQNAPPSERDDLSTSSFVGELVTDFGPVMDHHGATTFSQGTPTTAMESTSVLSIRASERTDEQQSVEDQVSVDSNLLDDGSVGAGDASVEANPPSEHGETLLSPLPDTSADMDNMRNHSREIVVVEQALNLWTDLSSSHDDGEHNDLSDLATLNAGVVNRNIRPGMVPPRIVPPLGYVNAHAVRRAVSAPASMNINVDGFDYDKDAPETPTRNAFPVMPPSDNLWSPGSRISMDPSPVNDRSASSMKARPELIGDASDDRQRPPIVIGSGTGCETTHFIPSIPDEIVTEHTSESSRAKTGTSLNYLEELDVKQYRRRTLVERAFPSRAMALGITVFVEVPVLITLLSDGDMLNSSLGRANHHLLMSLLPICCAISGKAGLQSFEMTTRCLAAGEIPKETATLWIREEVTAAAILGIGMGLLVGLLTFILSGFNPLSALAIFFGQSTSITIAGLTGVSMRLILEFAVEPHPPKWSGLLATSIQGAVPSFVMVFLTLKVVALFGHSSWDAQGVCSTA